MKPRHLIAPILVTLVIGFWLNGQENSLHLINERTRVLEERIDLVTRHDSSSTPTTETTKKEPTFLLPGGTLDWIILTGFLIDPNDPTELLFGRKAIIAMNEIFDDMTEDELASVYEEIQGLDLSDHVRECFRTSVMIPLTAKYPETALKLLGDSPIPNDDPRFNERRWAFASLAKKDSQKAALWLDRQIAIGSLATTILDPLQNPRLDLEAALLGQLLTSDPDTVKARLANFDAAERERILDNPSHWKSKGKILDDFLQLVRENLDEEKSTKIIASAWNQGFAKTALALKEIPFTETERTAIVNHTVESYLVGDSADHNYAPAFAWLQENAPSQAVSSIARSLSRNARSGTDVEKALQKSRELSASFDNPEITTEFVKQFAARSPGAMGDLLDAFQDPALAEQMREIFRALPESSE